MLHFVSAFSHPLQELICISVNMICILLSSVVFYSLRGRHPKCLIQSGTSLSNDFNFVSILLLSDVTKSGFHPSLVSQSTGSLGNHDSRDWVFKATGNKACRILSSITLKRGSGCSLLQNSSKEVVLFFW